MKCSTQNVEPVAESQDGEDKDNLSALLATLFKDYKELFHKIDSSETKKKQDDSQASSFLLDFFSYAVSAVVLASAGIAVGALVGACYAVSLELKSESHNPAEKVARSLGLLVLGAISGAFYGTVLGVYLGFNIAGPAMSGFFASVGDEIAGLKYPEQETSPVPMR